MMSSWFFSMIAAWAVDLTPGAAPGWAMDHQTEATGLPTDRTFLIAEDGEGRLWVGTASGLMVGNGAGWRMLRAGEPGGPPDNRPFFVQPDGSGGIWVVTESGAVQRRRGDAVTDLGRMGWPLAAVVPVWGSSPPLFTTGDGVFELNDQGLWLRDDLPALAGVMVEHDGALWWRLHDDHFRMDKATGERHAITAAEHWEVVLAASAARGRLGELEARDGRVMWRGEPIAVLPNPAFGVVGDGTELWVSMDDNLGLARVRRSPIVVHRPPPSVSSPNVAQVYLDDGTLWAVAFNRTAMWAVGDDRVYLKRPDLPDLGHTQLVTRAGRRWWVMEDGVAEALPDRGDGVIAFGPKVMVQKTTGALGLTLADGSWRSACVHHDEVTGWRPIPGCWDRPLLDARAIAEIPGVGVVIGGFGGIGLQTAIDQPMELLPTPEGSNIRHLRVGSGRLWMATESRGLCAVVLSELRAGAWRCVSVEHGLPEPLVHASAEDRHGRLWLTTDHGLVVVERGEVEAVFEGRASDLGVWTLGTTWGLPDEEFNGYAGRGLAEGPDGRLWLANVRGVVEVRPDDLPVPDRLEVVIAGLPQGALEHGHAPVTLDLLVQPRAVADVARLRVRRDGGAWMESGPYWTLSDLGPGEHHLEVQVRLLGGWQEGASAIVHRTPTFTESLNFYLLIGAGGLGLAVLGVVARNRRLERRQAELAALVQEQTGRLVAQNEVLSQQAGQLEAQNQTIRGQVERLSELDEIKRRFIADITHELRTPLSLVLGALDGPEQDTDTALSNARRLHTLVDELFDLSRLEGGKLQLRARRLALDEAVTEITRHFQAAFAACGRRLDVAVEQVVVWADRGLLEKIVANLVGNALKHGAGRVLVSVTATASEAVIVVSDEGPGVPEGERERVFERFVQLSSGDTRVSEGAGLGLALVRELAELHGGRAAVEDGARFVVGLPRGDAHVRLDEIDTRSSLSSIAEEERATGAGELLVVEDNDDMRAWIVRLLSSRWTVSSARNGEEGLAAVRERSPRLVVSDVRMPVMDGIGMARALRADGLDVPIVFVSAKAQPEDIEVGLAVGQAYLTKPFGAKALIAEVERWLAPVVVPEAEHLVAWRERLTALADARLADQHFGVGELASAIAMSPRALQRRMKELDLPPPATWLLERRLETAKDLLQRGALETVAEVAAAVGLSRSYFTRAYRAWAGVPPGREGSG